VVISNLSAATSATNASQSQEPRETPEASRFSEELAQRAKPQTVRAVRTPLGGEQAAQALEHAWQQVMGEKPSEETKAVLTAQWAHETGRGDKMMNFNFGGIKGSAPSGLGTEYKTREGWGKTEVRIVDRFRAYQSADEGATDYVKLLVRRYPEAVKAAQAGDPEQFVRELKRAHYFTGNETAYVRSVSSMANAALSSGFTALSGGSGAENAFPTYLEQTPTNHPTASYSAAAERSFATGPVELLSFTGVEAIVDEIGRAALRDATARSTEGSGRG